MQKPTVEIVTANKKLIMELIAKDTHNRKKKEAHIEYLRQEIREGRWHLTNQGIGVTVSGYICDGGHRLRAIALEGFPPVQFILVRNLPDSAQKYVDQHTKRTMADTLTLFFDQNIGTRIIACVNISVRALHKWHSSKLSPDQVIEALQLREHAIARFYSIEKARNLPAPVCAAFVDAYHETTDERVLKFVEQVIDGHMLQVGDPALTLRNWLASGNGPVGQGAFQRERYLKTQTAVKAFLDGRRITKLYRAEEQ